MQFTITISLIILTISFFNTQSRACLWENSGQPQVGKEFKVDGLTAEDFAKTFVSYEDRTYWEKVKADNARLENSAANPNNLAVALIHLGNVSEAIKILEKLENEKKGIYFTATNLGTAYELNGENQKALMWIKEGIKRNKDSHFGTEWLHIKILEAKLAMENNSDWLKNRSVLGLDFRDSKDNTANKKFVIDESGQEKSLSEIEKAFVYQLHERMEFVKPPEPIVANLLFDLSNIFSVTRKPEHAKFVKDLSVQYAANSESASRYNEPEKVSGGENKYFYLIITAIIAFLLISGIYYFMRKRILN